MRVSSSFNHSTQISLTYFYTLQLMENNTIKHCLAMEDLMLVIFIHSPTLVFMTILKTTTVFSKHQFSQRKVNKEKKVNSSCYLSSVRHNKMHHISPQVTTCPTDHSTMAWSETLVYQVSIVK